MEPIDYEIDQWGGIVRTADGCFIPVDPMNMDYQKYLEWAETHPAPAAPMTGTNPAP